MRDMRDSFLKFNLDKSYASIEFEIDGDIDFISINWKNNKEFFSFYLYSPDNKLCAQIIGISEKGTRILSKEVTKTSPCLLSLDKIKITKGMWRVDYTVITNTDACSTIIEIKEEKSSDIFYDDEYDLLENLYSDNLEESKEYYTCDFHTHTIFSDGLMTREENNDVAEKQGLDFFVPTDHNIFHYTWPKNSHVKTYPGIEITSSLGHINFLFAQKTPFEEHHANEIEDEEALSQIITEASNYSLVSINHPFMEPWDFKIKDFPLNRVKFMEIINSPTLPSANEAIEKALKAWNYLLNDGYKVVAIGGSDSHLKAGDKFYGSEYPCLLGDPKNFIYAHSNSVASFKEAMIKADVSVTRRDELKLIYTGLERENDCFNRNIKLVAYIMQECFHGSKLNIHWVLDGKVQKVDQCKQSSFESYIDCNYHWIRVDVRDEDGHLYGHSNPIFFNRNKIKHNMIVWKDLLDKIK